MQIQIPKELLQYVRMSKADGLVHRPDMPQELMPLFEKTKKAIMQKQNAQNDELSKLLIKED